MESEAGEEEPGLRRRLELEFGSEQRWKSGRRLEEELKLKSEWCCYRSGSGGWRSGGAADDDAGGEEGWRREAGPDPGVGCCGDGDS